MVRWSSLVVVVALSSACLADNVTFLRIDKSVLQQRLQQPPQSSDQRVRVVRKLFEEAGCPKQSVVVQSVPDQALPNVLCTLPGTDIGTILIASRLDYDERGDEGVVGWGGVVMLPLLAESLTSANHRHTLVFAAFTGGGNASGASWYWKNLSEAQRREFRGVVDLDHLGRTAAGFSVADNGGVMAGLLPAAARALRIEPEPQSITEVPEGNALFFQKAHIPAITLHSRGYVANGPDTEQQAADAMKQLPGDIRRVPATSSHSFALKTSLDPDIYNQTYNLLCVYVLFLDRGLGASKRAGADVLRAQSAPPPPSTPEQAASVAPTVNASASNAEPVARATEAPVAAVAAVSDHPAAPILPSPVGVGATDANNPPPPTFRVNTRLVQFDVVVTDKEGRPVKDLTASDFTVLQDGQVQTLHAFEFHAPVAVEKAGGAATASMKPANATLPKETYTNIPAQAPQSSWTIVLFDLLNTGVSDQAYARNQLLQLLRSVPRGEPTALFVLTRHLEMVQGFTQDPDQLLRMAESLNPSKSQVLTTMVERERTISGINTTAQQAAATTAAPANAGSFSTDSVAYAQAARIAQGYNDHEAFRTSDRALFTLEAMKGLARAVSGYPGRKNLVWLSGSFPLEIEPDPASTDPFRNMRGFEQEIRAASSLLATSRVAVYPVDVRGLQSKGIDITVASAETQVMNDAVPVSGQGVVSTSSSNLGATLTEQSVALANDRATMKNIAEQTGGEAFINTNDLRRVINRSLEDGSTYYTLAYTPPKDNANGGYHRVVVRVPNKNLKLAYRRGYFSIPQPSASGEAGTAALRAALQPGMPPATSMMLTASIELPDAARKEVKINYIINSNGVNFADVPDNKKRAQIDCMVIAFDSSGKEAAHASDTLDATIPPSIYSTVLTYGLPAHQLLSLPPGKYNLRIGVMDRTTQQIGTVDAPLVVPGESMAQR